MTINAMSSKTLRDAALVAVVAVLTVQALKRFCGDRYIVPSDSMQPLLYGDPQCGDVVFVDRMSAASLRRRGDLVVVDGQTGTELWSRGGIQALSGLLMADIDVDGLLELVAVDDLQSLWQ